MSTSQFCIQQRQQEQQKLNKIIIFGFASSALLHGIIALAIPYLSFNSDIQAEKPMKLILVDKPKPEPIKTVTPTVKPEPKPETKPAPPKIKPQLKPEPVKTVTPTVKPKPKLEPVKATPQPSVKQPQPIKSKVPSQQKPRQVLTNSNPVTSQPAISSTTEKTTQSHSSSNSSNGSISSSTNRNNDNNLEPSSITTATNSKPPKPQPKPQNKKISCVSNCQPKYPNVLAGAEGNVGIKLTLNGNGNVTSATISSANSNNQINRQALLAARQMKFSSFNSNSAEVQVTINFTVAGSEYDRLARQRQRERELAEKKRQQELARQQRLEREREARARQEQQQRQAEAEQKRQAELLQQQQQQRQQQQPAIPNSQPVSKPAPLPEADDEMLREFRQRIEQYQQENK